MAMMNAHKALLAYAIAAAELEDHKRATYQAEQRLQQAGQQAIDHLDSYIQFPVTVTLPDGRTVLISDVAEAYNYHLEYTIAQAL